MKRGDIVTVSGGGDYVGKPRPAVILQAHGFEELSSITLCAFTTHTNELKRLRPLIKTDKRNGLESTSRIMIDKITTVRRSRIDKQLGELDHEDIAKLDRALSVFLGLAPSPDIVP